MHGGSISRRVTEILRPWSSIALKNMIPEEKLAQNPLMVSIIKTLINVPICNSLMIDSILYLGHSRYRGDQLVEEIRERDRPS